MIQSRWETEADATKPFVRTSFGCVFSQVITVDRRINVIGCSSSLIMDSNFWQTHTASSIYSMIQMVVRGGVQCLLVADRVWYRRRSHSCVSNVRTAVRDLDSRIASESDPYLILNLLNPYLNDISNEGCSFVCFRVGHCSRDMPSMFDWLFVIEMFLFSICLLFFPAFFFVHRFVRYTRFHACENLFNRTREWFLRLKRSTKIFSHSLERCSFRGTSRCGWERCFSPCRRGCFRFAAHHRYVLRRNRSPFSISIVRKASQRAMSYCEKRNRNHSTSQYLCYILDGWVDRCRQVRKVTWMKWERNSTNDDDQRQQPFGESRWIGNEQMILPGKALSLPSVRIVWRVDDSIVLVKQCMPMPSWYYVDAQQTQDECTWMAST